MGDALFALLLGCAVWFAGGVAFVASLTTGGTVFAPFAAVVILLGIFYCIAGLVLWVRTRG